MEGEEYIYHKNLLDLKVLGHPLKTGIYIGGAYFYQIESQGLGAYVAGGAGIYVESPMFTSDFSYFLAGGASAEV